MYPPFYSKAAAVTASDTVAVSPAGVRGLSVKTAGDYTILLNGDTVAVTMTLASGVVHALNVKRVNLTGAAASTGIVAFY